MVHHTMVELDTKQMNLVCGGAPRAGHNLAQKFDSLAAKVSIKMNISFIFIINTVINAPLTINVNQGM